MASAASGFGSICRLDTMIKYRLAHLKATLLVDVPHAGACVARTLLALNLGESDPSQARSRSRQRGMWPRRSALESPLARVESSRILRGVRWQPMGASGGLAVASDAARVVPLGGRCDVGALPSRLAHVIRVHCLAGDGSPPARMDRLEAFADPGGWRSKRPSVPGWVLRTDECRARRLRRSVPCRRRQLEEPMAWV